MVSLHSPRTSLPARNFEYFSVSFLFFLHLFPLIISLISNFDTTIFFFIFFFLKKKNNCETLYDAYHISKYSLR